MVGGKFTWWRDDRVLNVVGVYSDNAYSVDQRSKSKLGTLMVYGDSIGVHYHKMATTRRLCKEIFRTCNKKYMWTYDVSSWKTHRGFEI